MRRVLFLEPKGLTLQYREWGETGMGFQILNASIGSEILLVLVRSDGVVLPFQEHDEFYSVSDFVHGKPMVELEQLRLRELSVQRFYAFRFAALNALAEVHLPPGYKPVAGAMPLIGEIILGGPTVFYRYAS